MVARLPRCARNDKGDFGRTLIRSRAIAFQIILPVTPAKAGVYEATNERTRNMDNDFSSWTPAFAGVTGL